MAFRAGNETDESLPKSSFRSAEVSYAEIGALLFPREEQGKPSWVRGESSVESIGEEGRILEASFFRYIEEFPDSSVRADGFGIMAGVPRGSFCFCRPAGPGRVLGVYCHPAGRGLRSVLAGTYLRGRLEAWLKTESLSSPGPALDRICAHMSDALDGKDLPGMFVLFAAAILDSVKGHVWIAGRGIDRIPLLRKNGAIAWIHPTPTPALGAVPNFVLEIQGIRKPGLFRVVPGDAMILHAMDFGETLGLPDESEEDFQASVLRAVRDRSGLDLPPSGGSPARRLDLSKLPSDSGFSERLVRAARQAAALRGIQDSPDSLALTLHWRG